MARPALTTDLPVSEFRSFYWLKAELLTFCRLHSLSTHGSKIEISERIATFLATGTRSLLPPARQQSERMPITFTRQSVIGSGWRCSEPLRAFFRSEVGPHFRFDQVMREFIAQGAGKTLQEAIEAWQQPRSATTIAPQFEYNRHMRAFFATQPDATREEAIRDWNEQRAQRRSPASEDS